MIKNGMKKLSRQDQKYSKSNYQTFDIFIDENQRDNILKSGFVLKPHILNLIRWYDG